jgi:hypothetical protein
METKLAALPMAVKLQTFVKAKIVDLDEDQLRRLLRTGQAPKTAAYKSGMFWFIRPRPFMHWFENRA